MSSLRNNANEWSVKVLGLSTDVGSTELSIQFDVNPRRISIHKSQSDSSEQYALIGEFPSEDKALEFISAWNETFSFGQAELRCELYNEQDGERIVDEYSNNRPNTSHSNCSTDKDEKSSCHAESSTDDPYASQQRSRSKDIPCRHDDRCFNADCPYRHSSNWNACKYGAQCTSFHCTANHPRTRKDKCRYGGGCRTSSCAFLHPNRNSDDKRSRKDRSVSPVRSRDDDSSQKSCSATNERSNDQRRQSHQRCKSKETRTNDRQNISAAVFAARTEFCERLQNEKILIVVGEIGTGKSTLLPQYAAKCFPDGLVVSVQPRSVLAMLLANRVADEYDGAPAGNSVGYQIGYDHKRKNDCVVGTNIMFMTDTVFLYEYQKDPNLSRIRVLIVDEVYERSLNIDIIIGIAKLVLINRPTDFYIVIASTTTNLQLFVDYFDVSSALVVRSKNPTYSVAVENQLPPDGCPNHKLIEVHVIPTLLNFYRKHREHTIVFLPGQRDIEKAIQVFSNDIPKDCIALPLYGSLSYEEYRQILEFDNKSPDKRMVLFCANIAETSIPIRNIQLVIDTGFIRQLRFDAEHNWNVLETVRISRCSASKRRDLVSHSKYGRCVRLYDDRDLKDEYIEPEILRVSFELPLLQFKRLNIDLHTFPFVTKPLTNIIHHSTDVLTQLCCLDQHKDITLRGQLFSELSIDPRLSAFMTNIYTEQSESQRLLSLITAIAAIISTPGSLFSSKETVHRHDVDLQHSATLNNDKCSSDLFRLCSMFDEWKSTGEIDRKTNRCLQCRKTFPSDVDYCQPCRIKHSSMNGLNNQILEHIESSTEFYKRTITDPRWNLKTGSRSFHKKWSDGDIIGKHLAKLFLTHVGHLLVPHLPDQGARLIESDIRVTIANRSIYTQHAHECAQQYFVATLITQISSGRYTIDRLHQIPTRDVPASPMQQILVRENIGESTDNKIRAELSNILSESWAKWLVHDYDRLSSRLVVWGLKGDQTRLESILGPILSKANIKNIECGSVRATFQNGLICSAVEIMEDDLRLCLQRVPCETFDELQVWFKTKLNITRHDIRENNFQECKTKHRKNSDDDDSDDDDDAYEAPPFYIVLKSTEAFQRATANLPAHHICSQQALSLSTTGTHMDEKDSWGRRLVLTIPAGSTSTNGKDILNRLIPHAVDCHGLGQRRSIRNQPGIQLINLPRDTDKSFVRKILQPINPLKISLRQTHKDNIGSSSAHIFFADQQQCQQAKATLQSGFCQKPITITVRNQANRQLVQKSVMPTLSDLESKQSNGQKFLVTATHRESALRLYKEIVPKLESSWAIDSTATVTVTHPHLYPDFDTLVAQIAKQFAVQVQQQPVVKRQPKGHAAVRCFFSNGSPQKTAAAAAMLSQATSPIIIKMTSDRQKQLFDELFSRNIIQGWATKLKLEVSRRERSHVWIEIRGPQVEQGELMRQIGDYSDTFDERFRVLELKSTVANFFGRRKLADVQLEALNDTWSNWGCHVTYKPKTKLIIIYADPDTNQSLIDSCTTEVKQLLTKLSADGNVTRDQQKCVFCGKVSYSTNTLRICGHAYCRCASTHLSSTYPLQCNEPKCKVNIAIEDLFEIFLEREALLTVCKKAIQIYFNNNAKTLDQAFCPSTECYALIKKSRGYQTCFSCGRDICPSCSMIDNDAHIGRTCKEREQFEKMGDFLTNLFKTAEKFARDNWLPTLPPIIRVDYNMALVDHCASLKRFYKGAESLGISAPPDMARGFFAFHGTAATAIKPICTDGFDPKRRSGQACGPGEYFGVTAAISHGYCRPLSPQGPYSMIIAFLLNCPQLSTRAGFCHVMNNPIDWSAAYNAPVVVVSYGTQSSCQSPLAN
ncbi:unnamed protein product [Adineta ricciae]|uniref:RNA helicase n=1 Tax=Adineta ricciae TaxID=249248 RepID=A0A815LXH9_ADIRI|nr:unnamed protein product [Adineta ricciae]